MKKYILIFFVIITISAIYAQTNPIIEIQIDGVPYNKFSIKTQGKISITASGNITITRIDITILSGKRPSARYQYSNIEEFNNSAFSSEFWNKVQLGNRVLVEVTHSGNNTIIKNIPVIE
jgi:hypothetical protein